MGKAERARRRARNAQATDPATGAADATRPKNAGRTDSPGGDRGPDAAEPPATTEQLIGRAVYALAHGDTEVFQRSADLLTARSDDSGPDDAAPVLFVRLVGDVGTAWDRGWQPGELVRQARRRRTDRHARLVADAMAAQMRRYAPSTVDDRWQAQLDAADVRVWWSEDAGYPRAWAQRERAILAEWVECALETVFELARLPSLARLLPLPGRGRPRPAGSGSGTGRGKRGAGDPDREPGGAAPQRRMLDRVRALLAKAEGTEFPQESEALTARAQELMARYSIDHALLAADDIEGGGDPEGPASRRVGLDEPYEGAKALLLDVVAEANRCRAVWMSDVGMSTVVGFPADLDAVELLFTSLLVQATSAMAKGEAHQRAGGRARTKTFRQTFQTAFAQRIGERLAEAAAAAERQAVAESGDRDLLPVLASRSEEVSRTADTLFPETVRSRVRGGYDEAGWESGRAAADLAPLRRHDEVGGTD